jgi:Peptidase family M23
MRLPILHLSLAVTFFAALFPFGGAAQSPSVTVTPAIVEAGSPELIRVTASPGAKIEGEWQGHTLQFFPGHSGLAWYALAGVDVEAPAGPSTLKVSIRLHNNLREVTSTITIRPAHYRTTSITVEPKFVEPGPEAQPQIDAGQKAKEKAFATTSDHPLWSGSFLAPVKAAPTDSFGTRRVFHGTTGNSKLASIHKGTDFRAHMGTPVLAGNSGRVVLAQPLYYEGNCVMIDHGLGLMSISMHLSRIDVKPGQQVTRGQQLGLSGATGRVTGPHLHWAIRWQGVMLDPVKLLRMNLNSLR